MQDFVRKIVFQLKCCGANIKFRWYFLSYRRKPLPVTGWNFSKLTPARPWCSHALTTWQSYDHGYKYGKLFNSLYHAIATYCNILYIAGFSYVGSANSYQKSTWSLGDKYIKEYNEWFLEQQTQFLLGRYQIVYMGPFFLTCWLSFTLKSYIHPLCPHKLYILVK